MPVEDHCDKKIGCESCNLSSECDETKKEAHIRELLENNLRQINKKLMIMSGKGGVGKSTVTVLLASALLQSGYSVGILDADIHGPNIPKLLGIEKMRMQGGEEGVEPIRVNDVLKVVSMAFLLKSKDDAVVWRGPLKMIALRQFLAEVTWGQLDYLLIDLPPGTGDEPLSIAQLIKNIDYGIVVTTPQEVSLLDARKAITFAKLLKIKKIGIVENMSGLKCPHCGKDIPIFGTDGGVQAAAELSIPLLAKIPFEPEIVTLCDKGEVLTGIPNTSDTMKAFFGVVNHI